MVPNGWSKQQISDVLQKVVIPVKPIEGEYYREIGIRSHGKGIFHKEPVTSEHIGNKRVFKIIENALIVNIVFAWEQAIAKTSKEELGFIASHRFPQFLPKKEKCDIDYLVYFFKTPKGKYLLELASPGGAGRNKTLGQKEFDNLKLILPSIYEQRKIAKILSTWDNAIRTTEELIETSKQQKKALMQQLLTGKKHLINPETGKAFDGDWDEVQLSDISKITMGSSPKSENYNVNSNGLPLIQGNADIKFRKSAPRIYTSQITKKCDVGDILLSVRAPVGSVAKSTHSACIGRGIAGLKAIGEHSQEFLYQWLLNFELKWEKFSQGSTFEAVNGNDIKALHVLLPDPEEQQKIASVLTAADKEIEVLETKLAHFKQEKKALMQQLLTGKRRVKLEGAA